MTNDLKTFNAIEFLKLLFFIDTVLISSKRISNVNRKQLKLNQINLYRNLKTAETYSLRSNVLLGKRYETTLSTCT